MKNSKKTALKKLTSCAAVSPAKISHTQERGRVLSGSVVDSGGNLCEPFAWYDQATQSWKMLQLSSNGEWEAFLETWPKAGMMRNGIAYRRAQSAQSTKENGSFSLPTIVATEGRGSCRNRYIGSQHFRGSKMSEGLRTCESDPLYTHPRFAEMMMGYPIGWTDLEP